MTTDIFEALGLDRNPFSMAADTQGYFHTDTTKQILDELSFGILSRKGFLLLTGEVGVGKTSLLYQLLRRLEHENLVTSWIFNTMLNKEELLHAIARDFGLDAPKSANVAQLIDLLQGYLVEQNAQDKNCAIIVDEAHNLSLPAMEALRMLSNLEVSGRKLVQILLVGQPELKERLDEQKLRQLRSRISIFKDLRAFDLEETGRYVNFKLSSASSQFRLTGAPLKLLFRATCGNTRMINLIMERALYAAVAFGESDFTVKVLRAAVAEIATCQIEVAERMGKGGRLFRYVAVAAGVLLLFAAAFAPYIPGQDGLRSPVALVAAKVSAMRANAALDEVREQARAEAMAKVAAEVRAETLKKAEAEARAEAEAGALADAQRRAEEKAKAEAEAEAKRKAAEKAKAEAEIERQAAEKAKAEADAERRAAEKAKAEADAERKAAEKAEADARAKRRAAQQAVAEKQDTRIPSASNASGAQAAAGPSNGPENRKVSLTTGPKIATSLDTTTKMPSGAGYDPSYYAFLKPVGLEASVDAFARAVAEKKIGVFEEVLPGGVQALKLDRLPAEKKIPFSAFPWKKTVDENPAWIVLWRPPFVIKDFYYGYRHEDILALQMMLKKLGYYWGPDDGMVGPVTWRAINSFQKDMKLKRTMWPDPETVFWLNVMSRQG
ncbi:AAA family ATPase [Desulfocurvus sp. DL9XJH121]